MLLIAAMMTVTVVAVKFAEIAARCTAIVAIDKITIIGCKTNCLGLPFVCIAAGCSPIFGDDEITSGEYHVQEGGKKLEKRRTNAIKT